MSDELSEPFLLLLNMNRGILTSDYTMIFGNICFTRRKGRKKTIHMNKKAILSYFFFPKAWAYSFINSGEDTDCQYSIVSHRKRIIENISFMEWQYNILAFVCSLMHRKHEKMLLTSSKQTLIKIL